MRREKSEQELRFAEWITQQENNRGEPYAKSTINHYLVGIRDGYKAFQPYKGYSDVFEIQSPVELKEYISYLKSAPGFKEYNEKKGNRACASGFLLYEKFLQSQNSGPVEPPTEEGHDNPGSIGITWNEYSHNRIVFGAPGTGKSFYIKKESEKLLSKGGSIERVTFHPDYSYASFVGTYKPVPAKDKDGNDIIKYDYVPGPFIRMYVEALKDSTKPCLLIIEEINRANMAAVFGDVFQLLDRDKKGNSIFSVTTSEDLRRYLCDKLGRGEKDHKTIALPENMFLWATMNSADQGVYPMDTAFKRRWDFEYIDIDSGEEEIRDVMVAIGKNPKQILSWNELRKAINDKLIDFGINEDKLIGPFFLPLESIIDNQEFIKLFKYKVLMYLFEDAARQKRPQLFEGCKAKLFSKICRSFDEKGVRIFCDDIAGRFKDSSDEDDK